MKQTHLYISQRHDPSSSLSASHLAVQSSPHQPLTQFPPPHHCLLPPRKNNNTRAVPLFPHPTYPTPIDSLTHSPTNNHQSSETGTPQLPHPSPLAARQVAASYQTQAQPQAPSSTQTKSKSEAWRVVTGPRSLLEPAPALHGAYAESPLTFTSLALPLPSAHFRVRCCRLDPRLAWNKRLHQCIAHHPARCLQATNGLVVVLARFTLQLLINSLRFVRGMPVSYTLSRTVGKDP